MKKISIGFCGYGYWGKNILRNLKSLNNVNVKYICDKSEENLNKAMQAYGTLTVCVYTNNYKKIIMDPKIDAIVLATPPKTHYELAYQAIKAGKHVFIEKPMTMNYQEAIDISGRAIEDGRVLMVGHTFVYNPVIGL